MRRWMEVFILCYEIFHNRLYDVPLNIPFFKGIYVVYLSWYFCGTKQ